MIASLSAGLSRVNRRRSEIISQNASRQGVVAKNKLAVVGLYFKRTPLSMKQKPDVLDLESAVGVAKFHLTRCWTVFFIVSDTSRDGS